MLRLPIPGPVQIASGEASATWSRVVHGVLAHREDLPENLQRVIALDPDCIAAPLLMAFGTRLLARTDHEPLVRDLLLDAERRLDARGTPMSYERALAESLGLWLGGDAPRAAARLDRGVVEHAGDPLLAKLAHALHFLCGDGESLVSAARDAVAHHPEDDPSHGFLLGCLGFALEEQGAIEEGEELGREAVRLRSDDVWALHAVAHALYETSRFEEGIDWLAAPEADLSGVGTLAAHVGWHAALFHIDADDLTRAENLLGQGILKPESLDYRDHSNPTTLLLLLQARGRDVRDHWSTLADVAAPHLDDHLSGFADVHYWLSLRFAERANDARRFLDGMRARASTSERFEARVLREAAIPALELLDDAWHGDRAKAAARLSAMRETLGLIGGSHAQRRVFHWALDAMP